METIIELPSIRLSLVYVCSPLFLLIRCPATVDSTQEEEDEWIKKYGVVEGTSGTWSALLDIQDNILALKGLCEQFHKKAHSKKGRVRVTEAYVTDLLLTFPHHKVTPIRATMAMYSIGEEQASPDQKVPSYHYFMKGTRPDCVISVLETKNEFRFGKQVCGIRLPKVDEVGDSSEEEYPSYDVPGDEISLTI